MSALDDKLAALLAKQGFGPAQPDTSLPKTSPGKDQKNTTVAGNGKKKTTTISKANAPSKTYENSLKFAHAYVRLQCNATAAYKDLFPDVTDASASTLGWKLLRKVEVQRILFPLLEGLMEKNEVDTQFVIGRLLEQADASPLDYFNITEHGTIDGLDLTSVTPAQRRNLKSIQISDTRYGQTIKVTVVDQQKAVEMFAKYLQMFTREMDEDDVERIGDLIEQGVKRIRKNKDLDAWKEGALDGQFSEVG